MDCVPVFDAMYKQQVDEPNDFEAVAFNGNFTQLMNPQLLTPSMQRQGLDSFQNLIFALIQMLPLMYSALKPFKLQIL